MKEGELSATLLEATEVQSRERWEADEEEEALLQEEELSTEELLTLRADAVYELVEGKLLERNMGAESSLLAESIRDRLKTHVKEHRLGRIFPSDCGYQAFPEKPKQVR